MRRLTKLYAEREGLSSAPLSNEEISMFMNHALSRTGADEMITPREIIRDYLTLLNILRDNKEASFSELLSKLKFSASADTEPQQVLSVKQKVSIKKVSLFDIDI